MSLRVARIEPDGIVHVASEGDITLQHIQAANNQNLLHHLLGDNWPENRLLIDLSQTTQIDSAAVGWLITTHEKITRHGGGIVLHSIRPSVRRVLEILHVDRLIDIVPDAEAGNALLRGGSK